MKVLKYILPRGMDYIELQVVKGFQPHTYDLQRGRMTIWGVGNPEEEEKETRIYYLFETGEPLPYGRKLEHRKTFLFEDDSYVLHLFEEAFC